MEEIKKESTQAAPRKRAAPVRKVVEPTASKEPTPIKAIHDDLPKPMSTGELRRLREDEARARLRREWEVESKPVTGIFRDLEVGPGGHIRFSARKYPWDQIESYDFNDGQTYTIPLWVARHLNENCKWPMYKHNIDPNAKHGDKVKTYVNQWNHRFAFVSSDFVHVPTNEPAQLYVPSK